MVQVIFNGLLQVPARIGCFRAGEPVAAAAGADTTTFRGSPGQSNHCIPHQSRLSVSGLGCVCSFKLGVTQMSQVLPLSVYKLLSIIPVLCTAALVPDQARRNIGSDNLSGKKYISEYQGTLIWICFSVISFSFCLSAAPLAMQDSISRC